MESKAEMWRAVEERDTTSDGKFVFAVLTTGIYCRPSCPGRRPKKENVAFYATPREAEEAGFRPCLRCKPRTPDTPQLAWVKRACEHIRKYSEKRITLKGLSEETGVSAYHLQRTFKQVIGLSPRQYQETCRIDRLKEKLRDGMPVTEAVHEVGYGSASWLYSDSKAKLGMAPGTYRRAGEGMRIEYRIVDSPLGRLLVARTKHGVCYIGLWDTEGELEEALRREYPSAEIVREDGKRYALTREVLDFLKGRATQLGNLPLDVVGTGFQMRVWKELQTIPRGSTRTYEDVAKSIRRPKAARAVGRACAANPVSLLIPCHRVMGKKGDLRGYRWGLERKRMLLEAERSEPSD